MHNTPNQTHNESHPTCSTLFQTALVAGYAIEADAIGVKLTGSTGHQALACVYSLGSPGTSEPLHHLQPWALDDQSPLAWHTEPSDAITRLVPTTVEGRATFMSRCKPLESIGGVSDAIGLRFTANDQATCTVVYLRHNGHPPFSGNNIWMLKHLKPAITKNVARAHTQWLKHQAWDPKARLGPISEPTHSTEELLKRLSKTERLVLERLRLWETEREVALAVGRSPHTVHVHVKSIYRKLMVTNRRQLLALVSTDKINNAPQHAPQSTGTFAH